MIESIWLAKEADIFFYIMVSFGFFIGIILMVAPEAYDSFNKALNKEYGLKFRFFPKIEDASVEYIDKIARKNSAISGMVLSIVSFVLLLIFR